MMTDPTDITQQEPLPELLTTAGAIWKQAAILKQQQKIPQQRWLKFAAKVRAKYASVWARVAALKSRVQSETADLPRLDVWASAAPKNQVQSETANLPRLDESPTSGTPATVTETTGVTPASELPPAIARSSHFLLDEGAKTFLTGLLNIRVPAVKIYANQTADAIAKKYGADAVTYRDKILFRAGKYNPHDVGGLALLGHELTHAAEAKMTEQNRSWGANLPDKQEQQALMNETKVWQHLLVPAHLSSDFSIANRDSTRRSLARSSHSNTPIVSRANQRRSPQLNHLQGQPQTALSSREVNLPPVTNMSSDSLPLTEPQLTQVYKYIMNRIREEAERGG